MARPDTARYDELLKAVLSIAGEPVSPGVASELLPTWIVEPGNAGHAIHRRERLLASYGSMSAGGAGTYGQLTLRNQAESNHLCILERIRWTAAGSTVLHVSVTEPGVDLGTMLIAMCRDSRLGDMSVSPPVRGVAGLVSRGTPAAFVTANLGTTAIPAANGAGLYESAVVLAPGSALTACVATANLDCEMSLDWIEIPINRFEQ